MGFRCHGSPKKDVKTICTCVYLAERYRDSPLQPAWVFLTLVNWVDNTESDLISSRLEYTNTELSASHIVPTPCFISGVTSKIATSFWKPQHFQLHMRHTITIHRVLTQIFSKLSHAVLRPPEKGNIWKQLVQEKTLQLEQPQDKNRKWSSITDGTVLSGFW